MAPVRRSLVFRSVVSITLMVLFYVLAAAAIAGLAWCGWELGGGVIAHARGKAMILGVICALALFASALVVLWSVIPRVDRFVPPGPELKKETHPKLFAEVEGIAAGCGEAMPEHVYLLNDVNAFVAQRGGVMGLGSHRVMGIGLPLFSALDVGELRSVLGHEFGHFYGGDTKLTPWVCKARRAMLSTVNNLAEASNSAAGAGDLAFVAFIFRAVRAPFRWYAEGYLRFTQAVSRAQELAADALGAKLAGASASIRALEKVELAGTAHRLFFNSELGPLVEQGRLPPITDGFRTFLGSSLVQELATALKEGPAASADPFDSHPPLHERVAALRELDSPQRAHGDERPAVELLGDLPGCERELLTFIMREPKPLTPIAWKDAGQVLAQGWKTEAAPIAKALGEHGFLDLPTTLQGQRALLERFAGQDVKQVPDDDVRNWARRAMIQLVFAGLVTRGHEADSLPGEPIRFRIGDTTHEPAKVLGDLLDQKASPDVWRAFCEQTGLAELQMAQLAAGAQANVR